MTKFGVLLAFFIILCARPVCAQTGCSRPGSVSIDGWNRMTAGEQEAVCRAADQKGAEQFRAAARAQLNQPYYTNPAICHDGWLAGGDNYILALEPWAERSGLLRGDRLDVIDGNSTEGGWANAMPRSRPKSGFFTVRVSRDNRPVDLTIECHEHKTYLSAERHMWEAVAGGEWASCVSATSDVERAFGRPVSLALGVRLRCIQERGWAEHGYFLSQANKQNYWSTFFQWATLLLSEQHFRPNGLTESRKQVLDTISKLEGAGMKEYASDLREQLSTATAGTDTNNTPSAAAEQAQQTASSGTAFVIDPRGYLLTAYHVVDGATDIAVRCPGGNARNAVVDAKAPLVDLAILKVDGRPFTDYLPLSTSEGRPPFMGQKVFTVGYPAPSILGTEPKFTDGTISALSGPGGDASFFQINVAIQPGNSGGALFDEKGHILGVVVAAASSAAFIKETGSLPQNVNWAVKASLAAPLVKPSRAGERRESIGSLATSEAVIAKATAASCLVVAVGGRQ